MTLPQCLAGAAAIAAMFAATTLARGQTCVALPLLVHNVDIWTTSGSLRQRDVLFRDGRVASIQRATRRAPQGYRTIDGTGHTLLPGLVDVHLHFNFPGGLPVVDVPRSDTATIAARELIQSGVTSGRLHLSALDEAVRLKQRSLDECAAIPRLQVGGPGLSGALQNDFNSFQSAPTEADALAKIERFAAAGVEWVAVHDAHRFAPGVLRAIADAARRARLRLMASGASPEEALAALSIRPDTIDYIDRTLQPGYAVEVLEQIRTQRDLVIAPTLGVAFRVSEYTRSPTRLEDPTNFGSIADADRAFLIATARKDLAGKEAASALAFASTLTAKLRQLRTVGRPLALASDAGSMLHWPANAVWWEMEAWRHAGASHREVLTAATQGGARVLRWTDVGHLALGARADFVLYRGNAEEGSFDRRRVLAVAKGGVLFTGDERILPNER